MVTYYTLNSGRRKRWLILWKSCVLVEEKESMVIYALHVILRSTGRNMQTSSEDRKLKAGNG